MRAPMIPPIETKVLEAKPVQRTALLAVLLPVPEAAEAIGEEALEPQLVTG